MKKLLSILICILMLSGCTKDYTGKETLKPVYITITSYQKAGGDRWKISVRIDVPSIKDEKFSYSFVDNVARYVIDNHVIRAGDLENIFFTDIVANGTPTNIILSFPKDYSLR